MGSCGASMLECDDNEEKKGIMCFSKCKDGFIRNGLDECCNPKTNICEQEFCAYFLWVRELHTKPHH